MGDLISSRMLDGLTAFFPSLCTIKGATLAQDAYGEPTETWTTVSGLSSLAARVAPAREREYQAVGLLVEESTHLAALQGYYVTITPAMRAVIDGVAYDVTGVHHDGQATMTYLGLKLVKASA